MPPAPPTFSMITGRRRISAMRAAMMRPTTSTPPAAENGMTMVIGRVGQSWLAAGAGSASDEASASADV